MSRYDDNDNYISDSDYNYVGSEGMYKRIARLNDYAALVKTIEGTIDHGMYDINVHESGLTITIMVSPKARIN